MAVEHRNMIINELKQGICEITWTDSFGVEHSVMGTLSTNHLDDNFENPYDVDDKYMVSFWDVNAESWSSIPAIRIVEMERLTGIGIKDDVDKVNIDRMEEFLYSEYYGGEEKPKWM